MVSSFTRFVVILALIFLFTVALFYMSVLLHLLLLLRIAVLYIDYWYVILPIVFVGSYILWRRGFRNMASALLVINISLFLLGGAIYLLWIALTE